MPIRPVSAWMDRAGFQSRCSAVKPRREHVVVSLQRLSRDDPSPTIQHNVLHNVALQVNNVALTVLNRDWSRKDVLRSDWLDIEIFTRFAPILTLLLGGSGGGVKPEAAARAGQQAVCSTPGLLHSSSPLPSTPVSAPQLPPPPPPRPYPPPIPRCRLRRRRCPPPRPSPRRCRLSPNTFYVMGCGSSSHPKEPPPAAPGVGGVDTVGATASATSAASDADSYEMLFRRTVEAGRQNGDSEETVVAALLREVFGPGGGGGPQLPPAEAAFYEGMCELSSPR